MRSQQEMFDLILNTAKSDDHIRAVILNGSRANPNIQKDLLQDFDVVYVVTDVTPFRKNLSWVDQFGERAILQMPDLMTNPPPPKDGPFAYLIQFTDGNRIDLTLYPLNKLATMHRDSLSILLLDKDGIIEPFPSPNESDYLPEPPTEKTYSDCCNEFWWVSPYVAKALWREDILYAKQLEQYVYKELHKMLTWYFGIKTEFSQNPGKGGKNFQNVLPPEMWLQLLNTFSNADYENTWQALFTRIDLFQKIAVSIGDHFGFAYPNEDDHKVTLFLKKLHQLPKNAQQFE